ncbi:hypothetical protein I2I11_09950 [Pontibacter sp. 172403-2]|nr:hypothetical protein [Pontibacter sp. 172403-2]MBF9253614.1 hypothetical protein [Pontibacter sp. 172403-2]
MILLYLAVCNRYIFMGFRQRLVWFISRMLFGLPDGPNWLHAKKQV